MYSTEYLFPLQSPRIDPPPPRLLANVSAALHAQRCLTPTTAKLPTKTGRFVRYSDMFGGELTKKLYTAAIMYNHTRPIFRK